MARQRKLNLWQHIETGKWLAGIAKDGSLILSPRIQDALLVFENSPYSEPGKDFRREWVITRPFSHPAPRISKAKVGKLKRKKTATAESEGHTE